MAFCWTNDIESVTENNWALNDVLTTLQIVSNGWVKVFSTSRQSRFESD
jgi:hypothetical protein